MPNTCVVGMQWGDEGKARIVDLYTARADIVVRTQGGANAGHTVVIGEEVYKFHQIPSGILHEDKECVIANGVVLDPELLMVEIEELVARGVQIDPDKLHISDRAQVVMPYHKMEDAFREDRAANKLGTTRRGIGPCYADKMSRMGLRVCDLLDGPTLAARLKDTLEAKRRVFSGTPYEAQLDYEAILEDFSAYGEKLRPFVKDTSAYLNEAIRGRKAILFEGAQGTLLDIDHGTYPFVTSSNASVCGVSAGAGIPPKHIGRVVGALKAYTTRVGEGPFPTEQLNETGERLRDRGAEYGATTGRPRRCGWLDGVACRHATEINGIDALAVTKLDVLTGESTVKVAVAYRHRGKRLTRFPADIAFLAECEPEYKEMPGWAQDITTARSLDSLPDPTRRYLDYISTLAGAPIDVVTVGAERDQTILVNGEA